MHYVNSDSILIIEKVIILIIIFARNFITRSTSYFPKRASKGDIGILS